MCLGRKEAGEGINVLQWGRSMMSFLIKLGHTEKIPGSLSNTILTLSCQDLPLMMG